jgi:hypothetical protein
MSAPFGFPFSLHLQKVEVSLGGGLSNDACGRESTNSRQKSQQELLITIQKLSWKRILGNHTYRKYSLALKSPNLTDGLNHRVRLCG